MIRHIVMWKLDSSYTEEQKEQFIQEFSEKLLNLDGKIDELKSIAVFTNSPEAPDANYEIMLDSTFSNMADLETYAAHPEHLKVIAYVKQYKLQRSCVDYNF